MKLTINNSNTYLTNVDLEHRLIILV